MIHRLNKDKIKSVEEIMQWDKTAFELVNSSWTTSWLDTVMPLLTDLHNQPLALIPLITILAIWIYKKRKTAVVMILGLTLCWVTAETIGYRLIKSSVDRARPQYTEGLNVQLKSHSHSGNSFPSLHSSNVFACATFLSLAYPFLSPIFVLIAALIAYSRVYVGVHFPLDVLGGMIIGIFSGCLVWFLLTRLKMTKIHFAREAQIRSGHSETST